MHQSVHLPTRMFAYDVAIVVAYAVAIVVAYVVAIVAMLFHCSTSIS